MDQTRFARTWQTLNAGILEGVAPGMVAGLWDARAPDEFQVAFVGNRRNFPPELPTLPMQADTVFDLASLTKVMATATLAAVLVDRGWLSWETELGAILPEASHPGVQIRHLLSHTAGFVAWEPLWERMRERFGPAPVWQASVASRQKAMQEFVFGIKPDVAPGVRAVYSDISFLLLGYALEEITRMSLDHAVKHFVWKPMGLDGRLFYRPVTADAAHSRIENVAATESSLWRGGLLQGQVHDDNCWSMGGYGGHAGAFGSVREVLEFARALIPRAGHSGFLTPATLRAAWTPVSEPASCSRTLGWDTPSGDAPSAGRYFSKSSVGHLGYTGTSLWIDPDAGLAVALLTNRVHPSRENELIRSFRPRFHEAIRLDLRHDSQYEHVIPAASAVRES